MIGGNEMKESIKSPIRVLHIIPGFGGGISSHVRNMLHGVQSDHVCMYVAGFTDYPADFIKEVEKKNGKTFRLSNVRVKNVLHCIRELYSILDKEKIDVVHVHMCGVQAFYFCVLSMIFGIKRRIVHAHIADAQGSQKVFFKIKRQVEQWLTVSFATDLASCSKISSEFRYGSNAVKKNKVMHIPNSINVKQYFAPLDYEKKGAYYNEFGIRPNQLIIGHVGFFGYQKNHPFMFKIAEKMKQQGIDFVWLFVGTGYNYDEYVAMAEKMGLKDCVRFLGRRTDVCDLYKFMNVSVLASHFEGLPTVTIETQAAGTATVISDSISKETDMGLEIIERVSLNDPIEKWIDAILRMAEKDTPNAEIRHNNIRKRCFTTETAARLYTAFLERRIMTYNLGDTSVSV